MQIGFFGLLTILFVGLKLAGFIDWSWVWVLAPFWISILLAVFALLLLAIIGAFRARNGGRTGR